jgi:formamidopyrimidine-DNA glycosylase
MPELPEVQVVVDTLRPNLIGRRIVAIHTLRKDIVEPAAFDLPSHLIDASITGLSRRAKRIVFELHSRDRFFIHLGMTGQLTVDAINQPLKRHTHFVAELDTGNQLRFVDPRRFGGIFWLGPLAGDSIGPEPLTMRSAALARNLSRTRRAIKTALLDQRVIAGIGNIYADESLHAARIHPLTPARELSPDQIATLTRAIKKVLRRAIRAGGSTLRDYVNGRGERGSFQLRHKVYDRAALPCLTCGSPIERAVVGGRSTHWCPRCQPARS